MAQAVFNKGGHLTDLPGFMGVGHLRVGISSTSLSCANVYGFSILPQGAPLMQRPNLSTLMPQASLSLTIEI